MNVSNLIPLLIFGMTLISHSIAPTSDLMVRSSAGRPDSLKPGDQAPTFVLRDIVTGDPVFLTDYSARTLRKGSKNTTQHAVVLSFWATWCEPCKKEIPILTTVADQFKGKPVKFFLVNTLEQTKEPSHTEDSVKVVLKARGYTLPCLVDAIGRVANKYEVRSLPVLVVIDKFGVVQKINRGYVQDFEIELANLLNDLVKE